MKKGFSVLALLLVFALQYFAQNQAPKNYKFINGRWFDGKTFSAQVFYSASGKLTKKKPAGEVETIDLQGGFVVPPFAEAHNHNVGGGINYDAEQMRATIQRYLEAGVFYVKVPGNPHENSAKLRAGLINKRDSIDVSFANDILTSKDGHPIGMVLDSMKEAGVSIPIAELEGRGFLIIDNEDDLNKKWPQIMAGKPDFIKTVLSYSDIPGRHDNPKNYGYNGLDPKVLALVVKKAHAAGLRVSTHITTVGDFKNAVDAGVDEINHLPAYHPYLPGTTLQDHLISADTAKLAAKKNIIVVTTVGVAKLFAKDKVLADIQEGQKRNLRTLADAGVRIAIGSDIYTEASVEEAMCVKSLGVFTNTELLNMWTGGAALTIFPGRKIGQLKEGYEASFIVLKGDPTKDFDQVKNIQLRFKDGYVLALASQLNR